MSPTEKTALLRRNLSLLSSAIFTVFFLYISFQSAAGSLLTRKLMAQKLTLREARETGRKLIQYHPYGIHQLPAGMIYFCNIRKDPATALLFIEAIQKGVIPQYGNIERYKGDFLLQLGRVEEACRAYWQEGENFPLSVTPIYKLMQIASIRGEQEKARRLQETLTARMKARSINEKMLFFILQHPQYDMRPWLIPAIHGGPESERSFKFQKIGTEHAGGTF